MSHDAIFALGFGIIAVLGAIGGLIATIQMMLEGDLWETFGFWAMAGLCSIGIGFCGIMLILASFSL